MKSEIDSEAGELTLEFPSRDEMRFFFEQAVAEGGLLVSLDAELGFRRQLGLRARSGDGVEFECRAEVSGVSKTSSGEFATALLLDSWSSVDAERLKLALAAGARAEPAPGGTADAAEESAAGETRGTSPMHRIRSMTPPERTRLARKANRVERQILLNDNSAQVLQALLANPRLEGKDVVRLVKSTHTNAPLLKRIVEDGRWGQNQELLGLVAKNPKTPSPVAIRLVEKLRTSDLRFMAKLSSGVRENIRRAALREYLRRTGR